MSTKSPTSADAAPTPPPQAVEAGYKKLVFEEKFSDINDFSNRWFKKFSWYPDPYGVSITPIPGGGVSLGTGGDNFHYVNHPIDTNTYGSGYLFGYFEASMRIRGPNVANSWAAFWLEAKDLLENKADDGTGTLRWCEIDIFEAFGRHQANQTVHSWVMPSGGAMQDTFNPTHLHDVTPLDPLDGKWHTFGVTWSPGYIAWYIDEKLISTHTSFSICDTQPMTLVVSAQSLTNDDTQYTDVRWIRVWQK